MANRELFDEIIINKKHFMSVLKERGVSIRALGNAKDEIQRTERTIRRCLNEGKMPIGLVRNIAEYIGVPSEHLINAKGEQENEISQLIALLEEMKKDCTIKMKSFLEGGLNGPAFEMRGKAEAFETVALMLESQEFYQFMKQKFMKGE